MTDILNKKQLKSADLVTLLKARADGLVEFYLVDVREEYEYKSSRIKGVDFLVPTSNMEDSIKKIEHLKEKYIILYCHIGNRSSYCQKLFEQYGYKHIGNLTFGIISYKGDIDRD